MNPPNGKTSLCRIDLLCMSGVMLLHLLTALFYVNVFGIDIQIDSERNTWDWFWQTLPLDALRSDLLHSIWHLHAQPPLFNLYGGIVAKLFFPFHLEAMHFFNIVMGSLLCGLVYLMTAHLSPRRSIAMVWAIILALNPALFLYEAFILYTLPTAFLIVINLSCVLWFERTRSDCAVYCFAGSLNLLILMRSLYHVALIPLALAFIWLISEHKYRWRRLFVCAAISMLSLGWCAKNYTQFGFFGTSSWSGMGLWRIASTGVSQTELVNHFIDGDVDRLVVERLPFSYPSEYEAYGFQKCSCITVLSNDDFNNINIPDISAQYGANAIRLIKRAPRKYILTVYDSYHLYCKSSSKYLAMNAKKINWHEKLYAHYLQGAALQPRRKELSVFLFIFLPIALILYTTHFFGRCIRNHGRFTRVLRNDCLMFWLYVIILYTSVVGCTMEYGENERFKFLVEQPIWIFIPVVIGRFILSLTSKTEMETSSHSNKSLI